MRVLALHAGALGDCVLALHVVEALRNTWDASVTMVARSPIAGWAEGYGLVSKAFSFEHALVRGIYGSDQALPSETVEFLSGFDRIVSFLGRIDGPVSMKLSTFQGPEVLAIDPRPIAELTANGMHITQQWIDQLAAHGYHAEVTPPTLQFPPSKRRATRDLLAKRLGDRPGRLVLCHPGSGGLKKCCPIEACEQLVEATRSCGWSVGWMIGPDELERFGPPYVQRLERTARVIYEESVEVAADLVSGADGYIGHDAGMTHVAALARIPTVALFGPTDPQVWRPLGSACRVVSFPPEDGSLDSWIGQVLLHVGKSNGASHDGARAATP